jgi:preprotein translocase SecE subunit
VADESKPKRRLKRAKPAETVRERAAQSSKSAEKKSKQTKKSRKAFAPLRAVGRFLRKISRFVIPPYFRNSWRELRQVAWPSRRESIRLTGAVIIFAVIFGVIVAIADYGLDKVFKKVILKQ